MHILRNTSSGIHCLRGELDRPNRSVTFLLFYFSIALLFQSPSGLFYVSTFLLVQFPSGFFYFSSFLPDCSTFLLFCFSSCLPDFSLFVLFQFPSGLFYFSTVLPLFYFSIFLVQFVYFPANVAIHRMFPLHFCTQGIFVLRAILYVCLLIAFLYLVHFRIVLRAFLYLGQFCT